MKKKLWSLALVLAGLAVPISALHALMIAPPPGPVRIANSDAIFIGKVLEFVPVDVEAKQFPGAKTTVKYRVAIVKVTEIIRGLKNEKTVRVGFVPPPPVGKPMPGKPFIIGGRFRGPTLTAGQEGLFMVSKHAGGKFYQAPNYGYFVSIEQKNFKEEVASAKKVVAMLGNITGALKSKDADERLMAAAIQIGRYRMPKTFPNKEEPISAEESKLILNALATAKWQQQPKFGEANPWQLFNQLGVRAEDGWKSPMNIKGQDDLRDAVQAWIRAHGDGYRIKRFVPSK